MRNSRSFTPADSRGPVAADAPQVAADAPQVAADGLVGREVAADGRGPVAADGPVGRGEVAADAPVGRGLLARPSRRYAIWLAAVLWAALLAPLTRWGLPSRQADDLLFGGDPPWSAAQYHAAAALDARQQRGGGADTDLNPLARRDRIVDLTATASDRAEILRRYRLFSRQPDEMITLMALQRMHPRQLDFDPRLYQYGGGYIYLIGAALGASSALGITHLSSDAALYLEHPEEFARFYLVARVVTLAFGALLLVAIWKLAERAAGQVAAWLAALLLACTPVFISGVLEAKPHLPSACMVLWATLAALDYHATGRRRDAIRLGLFAGYAFGLVLTGVVALALWPALFIVRRRALRQGRDGPRNDGAEFGRFALASASGSDHGASGPDHGASGSDHGASGSDHGASSSDHGASGSDQGASSSDHGASGSDQGASNSYRVPRRPLLRHLLLAGLIAAVVYGLTNPYIPYNYLFNRSALASNVENSTAMYAGQMRHAAAGAVRVAELLYESAGRGLLAAGLVGLIWLARRRPWQTLTAASSGLAMLLICVLLGANKPAEYARFLVLPVSLIAIAAASALAALGAAVIPATGGAAGGRGSCRAGRATPARRDWQAAQGGSASSAPTDSASAGRWRAPLMVFAAIVVLVTMKTPTYVQSFIEDAGGRTESRRLAGIVLGDLAAPGESIAVLQEPAPFAVPPLDFAHRRILWLPPQAPPDLTAECLPNWLVFTADDETAYRDAWWRQYYRAPAVLPLPATYSRITWADKPVLVYQHQRPAPLQK